MVAKYPVNFADCLPPPAGAPPCPRPTGPGDGFKEKAKAAIVAFLGQLPARTQVGLVVYGHKGANNPAGKAASCAGVEAVYPLGRLNTAGLAAAVRRFQPTGYTPVAAALQQCGTLLQPFDSATHSNLVYLVSDGIETCGGDPTAAARALRGSRFGVLVNVIGFDVDQAGQRQMREVARAGGGDYFDVHSGAELSKVFDNTRQRLNALADYRDCLASAAYKQYMARYASATDYFLCMRDKRNQVYLGVRAEKQKLIGTPQQRCLAEIDRLNDAWNAAIDRHIAATHARLQARRDVDYHALRQAVDSVEAERQQLLHP